MAHKSKAGSETNLRSKVTASAGEKPQRERFIAAARERDVTQKGFERLFAKVVRPKKGSSSR